LHTFIGDKQNTKYNIVLNHYFNTIASQKDGLASLNTAFTQEGVFIHIPKSGDCGTDLLKFYT
jgi:hypothetical protein